MCMAKLLQVNNLCCSIGGRAILNNVSLAINRGEILGLAGGSGSGKSTLANCIVGLLPFQHGRIELAGNCLPKQRSRRDFLAQAPLLQMVFQDPLASVNPRWCVAEILAEPIRQLDKQQRTATVAQWLDRVALPQHFLNRYPRELSGGQLQRLNIARALINQPELLVCDEALAALDVATQAHIANLLKDLREQLGTSLLFIGHDLAMMNFLCDTIAVLQRGEIVECSSAHTLLTAPAHPYSQQLLQNARQTHALNVP